MYKLSTSAARFGSRAHAEGYAMSAAVVLPMVNSNQHFGFMWGNASLANNPETVCFLHPESCDWMRSIKGSYSQP